MCENFYVSKNLNALKFKLNIWKKTIIFLLEQKLFGNK